jgi:hypothetical protein
VRTELIFSISPSLILSTTTGNVGMTLDVIGAGFNASSTVTVLYGGSLARSTALTDDAGSFRVRFAVPKSKHGDHVITAQDRRGDMGETTFIVENTPPETPSLLGPANGGKGAIFGGYRPTFRWSPSDDPSGATYTLQVDNTPDFSNPLLVKPELTTLSYMLGEQEELPRGTYYWRVKATDSASNEGSWSSAFVVKSGTVPLWLFPALGAVVILGAGGGAYAIKLRARRRREKAIFVPVWEDAIREMPTEPSIPSSRPVRPSELAPPPRIALPAPRRGHSLPPEELARLQLLMDFVRSMPLIRVTPDLAWLEELISTAGSAGSDMHAEALTGTLSVRYQPAWMRHPTYAEVLRVLQGQPFLQRLEEYITAVDGCAADALPLLRAVYEDLTASLSPETPADHRWRLALAAVQDALAWFRGTHLKEPSAREYVLRSVTDGSEASKQASVVSTDDTAFRGLLIEGITESDAISYRDTHIQVRNRYRDGEQARLLAAKMAQMDVLREQLMRAVGQLDRQA